jgi:hypothetical protein
VIENIISTGREFHKINKIQVGTKDRYMEAIEISQDTAVIVWLLGKKLVNNLNERVVYYPQFISWNSRSYVNAD